MIFEKIPDAFQNPYIKGKNSRHPGIPYIKRFRAPPKESPVNFSIRTTGDPLPWLKRLDRDLSSPQASRVVKSMGKAAGKTVRDHFRSLSASRHRGAAPGDFYGDAAAATNEEFEGSKIVVVVGQLRAGVPGTAVALRYFGNASGITTDKAFLTIPVDPIAYGRRALEFKGRSSVIFNPKTGKGVITLADRVIYALVKKTKPIRPDPTVLPTAAAVAAAMATAAEEVVDRIRRSS